MASKSKIDLSKTKSLIGTVADKIGGIEDKDKFNFRAIDINLIVRSQRNFFELRDVELLAEDIKINGLYHNLVVKKIENGNYEIISGERRFEALKILDYKKAPCLVKEDVNDVDSEIMLIQANKNTRELTEGEKATMISRLEELYKQKKANGEKIEGKLRDKIGNDMGLSGTQVHRYQKINDNLIPELKSLFNNSDITLRDSYDFSKMSEEEQKGIYEFLSSNMSASKSEIETLKKELKSKDEVISKTISSNEKLNEENNELKNNLENKQKELDENIDIIKATIKDEVEKQNSAKLDVLNKQLKSLIQEKDNIENELIEAANKQQMDIDTIKQNTELNVILNNIESAIVKFKSIKDPTLENREKLKILQSSISEILNL